MQQTKFDRWLKEKFIYETHIFTLRLPEEGVPRGVKVRTIEKDQAGEYNYKLIVKSAKKADQMINILKDDHLMYATRVVEGRHFYNGIISPEGKSFTFLWIFRVLSLSFMCYLAWSGYHLWKNEEFRSLIINTLNDFRVNS